MIDLDALEKLARAATPGPWATDDPWIVYAKVHDEIVYLAKTAGLDTTRTQYPKDADYIAAANPSVILDLIALARAATDSLPKVTEGALIASFSGDERFNALLDAAIVAEYAAMRRLGTAGTGLAAASATKALIAYLDSNRAAPASQAAAPAHEPVAIVGEQYSLHWIGTGPIEPIIEKHQIGPGAKLYCVESVPPPEGWRDVIAHMREHLETFGSCASAADVTLDGVCDRLDELELAGAAPVEAAKWVSVEDRLPENMQQVLTCGPMYDEPGRGMWIESAKFSGMFFDFNDDEGEGHYAPTHWMPMIKLPAAPTPGAQ